MGETDDDWNQVIRKRGRKPVSAQPKNHGLVDGIRPNITPELTVSDIRKYHESISREWSGSECWQKLQESLVAGYAARGSPGITAAVCLGPGPFDPENGSLQIRRTAHMQTAAFESIVTSLEAQSGRSIRRIIQEPAFTCVDKEFCKGLGFEVVDTPDAFAMVDSTTLAFGIHMELQTYAEVLTTLPGIFIGSGLKEWEKLMNVSPDIPGLISMRRMDAEYERFPFPDFNYMFYGTIMYWRRTSGAPEDPMKQQG